MPPRGRPRRHPPTTPNSSSAAAAGPSSSFPLGSGSEDEIALTPVNRRAPTGSSSQVAASSSIRTTRTRISAVEDESSPVGSRREGGGGRMTRAKRKVERAIVPLGQDELLPPSSEDEYEDWLVRRTLPQYRYQQDQSQSSIRKGKEKEREDSRTVSSMSMSMSLDESRFEGRQRDMNKPRRQFHKLISSPSPQPSSSTSSFSFPASSLDQSPSGRRIRDRSRSNSWSRETSPTQPLTFILGDDESLVHIPLHDVELEPGLEMDIDVDSDNGMNFGKERKGRRLKQWSPDELDLLAQPGPSDWYLRQSQSQSPSQLKLLSPNKLDYPQPSLVQVDNGRVSPSASPLGLSLNANLDEDEHKSSHRNSLPIHTPTRSQNQSRNKLSYIPARPIFSPSTPIIENNNSPQPLAFPPDTHSPTQSRLENTSAVHHTRSRSSTPKTNLFRAEEKRADVPFERQHWSHTPETIPLHFMDMESQLPHETQHRSLTPETIPLHMIDAESQHPPTCDRSRAVTPNTIVNGIEHFENTLSPLVGATRSPLIDSDIPHETPPPTPHFDASLIPAFQSPTHAETSHRPDSSSAPASLKEAERPPPPPADPRLEQFRTARTFRTRTVLQLQPYTKERQMYEAVLRRGGLKKGKKAVAQAKEITRDEEDDELEGGNDESSEASVVEEESSERIVIGNTPPEKEKRTLKQRPIIEVDLDEYFLEYGTVADQEDEEVVEILQKIARNRIRVEKEERKRKRLAEREKRAFDNFMKEVRGEAQDSEAEPEPPDRPPDLPRQPVRRPLEPRKTTVRTPGGTKTYASKDRHRQPVIQPPSSGSDSDGVRSVPPPSFQSPAKSATGTSTASFRTAHSFNGDMEMDVGYGQPSFILDDLPHSPPRTRRQSSSSSSSSSTAEIAPDKRKRIAGRMMPAAMLKKLEADAAAKEKKMSESRRRGQQRVSESPVRPGRAVVRRGAGNGLDDMNDLFNDASSSPEGSPVPMSGLDRDYASTFEQPIVVDDSDSSSEAAEDNHTEHTLARLHHGDFEGIVSGDRWRQSDIQRRKENRTGHIHRQSRARRPALGLTKRHATHSVGNRGMLQTRLDFPLVEKSPAPQNRYDPKQRKRKRSSKIRTGKRRPAIHLNDHVIFATADFEFDSQDEDLPSQPRPPAKTAKTRPFARTASNVSITAGQNGDALDAGIGKARSWANFDKFPIDFDITPLPSGLYCQEDTVPGNGKLRRLVDNLRGVPVIDDRLESIRQYGIELQPDMTPEGIGSVVPLIFDSTFRQMVALANQDSREGLSIMALNFLGGYLNIRRDSIDESTAALRTEVMDQVQTMGTKLDEIDVGQERSAHSAREALLNLKWSLFELTCRLTMTDELARTAVEDSAVALLRQLLSGGFDKTVRPLKSIMRGLSDSAEISDLTVTLWIALIHTLSASDEKQKQIIGSSFNSCLGRAIDLVFHLDRTGPLAAERIWFLVFGLCALSQFNVDGKITSIFTSFPRWMLVRRAVGLIKVAFDEEAEKRAHFDQLQGRDRYIKVMMARCVRLSSVWRWSFDRESFSVATRDLGVIFKDRQYRNLPTEPAVDYPQFISRFDMSLTAVEDSKRETAFELYLRLVCVAASDIISSASTYSEAEQSEKDVQRLIMSIVPVSPVKFSRLFPPNKKEIGQLINRYSVMVAACYFSPSLLGYLLANAKRWSDFQKADLNSRQITIRGLMYLAIACNHHRHPLKTVVDRLAEILGILHQELETNFEKEKQNQNQNQNQTPASNNNVIGKINGPDKKEIEKTMVLVVSCFKQIIKHHSFDIEKQTEPVYPDPYLLHESWTTKIFDLDLTSDLSCGLEVISTIQTFLDTRSEALPHLAKQRRTARAKETEKGREQEKEQEQSESLDEFGSLGIDFTDADVLALGGEAQGGEEMDIVHEQDLKFAEIIENVISPRIYKLLSDILPPVPIIPSTDDGDDEDQYRYKRRMERQTFISRLTKCWSDCAAVLVVEHQKLDWSTFISPFGRQSWARLGDECGRVQVGLQFMLNVARLDPGAFVHHEEDFISLLFQVIGTNLPTVEHEYISALLHMKNSTDHPLLSPLIMMSIDGEIGEMIKTKENFMDCRGEILRAIFKAIPEILCSSKTISTTKIFIYKCMNLFVSSLITYDKSIPSDKVIHKESYRNFVRSTLKDLSKFAGGYITPMSVPTLKYFADIFK